MHSTTPRSSTACASRRRRERSIRTPTSAPCGRVLARGASSRAADGTGEPYRLILVVTDGVFSMDGDIAPLPGIVEAAEAVGAAVFVDDAHASGVLGRNGRGTVDHFGLHGRVAIQVGTLSKAIGVARRLRRRQPGLRDILDPAGPAVPVLDLASAGRRRRVSRGPPGHAGGAGAHRAAVGEHAPVQGGARPAWASTPAARRRPITPVMMGDPEHRRALQRAPVRRGRLRPACRVPDGRDGPGRTAHHRHRGAR